MSLPTTHPFDIEAVKKRLQAGTGGYEIVHQSAGPIDALASS